MSAGSSWRVDAPTAARRSTGQPEEPQAVATVGRVLDELGRTLLDPAVDPIDRNRIIDGVVMFDPRDPVPAPPQSIVLATGLAGAETITRTVDALGADQAGALVVRAPVEVDDGVRDAVRRTGVPLLALTPGASWLQLAALLQSLIRDQDVADAGGQTIGGEQPGDLFAVANSVAALLDAPVTIEDLGSRVLAFSGRQEEADPSRIQTILGRQVPERLSRVLTDTGVFARLYSGDLPVYVDPPDLPDSDFSVTRVAIAVRAGDEVLGSIWASVRGRRLPPEREHALRDAAPVVALHLLRLRATHDVGRHLHAGLLATALGGGAAGADALSRLHLRHQPVVVLAATVLGADSEYGGGGVDGDATWAVHQQRVCNALAMHLSAIHPRSVTVQVRDIAYGVLPVLARTGQPPSARARQVAQDFLGRIGDRLPVVIGVGELSPPGDGLDASRAGADRALRILRTGSRARAARLSDVPVEALLLDLADLADSRSIQIPGPLMTLVDYDQGHDGVLLDTLEAWFDLFGDIPRAADRLHIHPNTFRYRLRRLREVSGLDLDDADTRLAAMVHLRQFREIQSRQP